MADRLVRLDDVLRMVSEYVAPGTRELIAAALVALPEAPGQHWQTDDICDAGHGKDPGYPCPECAKTP